MLAAISPVLPARATAPLRAQRSARVAAARCAISAL